MNSLDQDEPLDWTRAQIAVRKFSETTDVHLELLNSHRKAIERLCKAKNHQGLMREKLNADRTLKQVVNDMQQMMLIGSSLSRNDLYRFELVVNPLKRKVNSEIREFLETCESYVLTDAHQNETETGTNLDSTNAQNKAGNETCLASSDANIVSLVDELKQNAEIHQQLLRDVSDLNETMKDLSNLIESQHHTVDRVENNVERTLDNVTKGEKYLKQAAAYKAAACGAIIGALVGGPAGMLIGFKTAALAALGGSALGAYSSRYVKKRIESRRNSRASCEMKPLTSSSGQSSHLKHD